MPHHLPLLALKQGAPTAMLNEDAEEQDRAFHHERFSQFMRNSPRQTDNPTILQDTVTNVISSTLGIGGFEGFKITGQPYNCVCVGTVTSTKIFHENCNYFPICFHGQCVFGNILLPTRGCKLS